jgi:transposase
MDTSLQQLSKQELIALLQQEKEAVRLQEKTILEQVNQVTGYQSQVADYQHQLTQQQDQLTGYQHQVSRYEDELAYLKARLEQYKRMLFGQKRERFEGDVSQLSLPFQASEQELSQQQQQLTEKITYVRKKQSATSHQGRIALPAHLPVEEVEIYPEGDLSEMTCIGKEVTDELECVPARLFIRRYIRYKYAPKNKEGVLMASLPERVLDKAIPGPGLLASILVDKYMDHLPLYRQRQRFLREQIPIAASTLEGWVKASLDRLSILYD